MKSLCSTLLYLLTSTNSIFARESLSIYSFDQLNVNSNPELRIIGKLSILSRRMHCEFKSAISTFSSNLNDTCDQCRDYLYISDFTMLLKSLNDSNGSRGFFTLQLHMYRTKDEQFWICGRRLFIYGICQSFPSLAVRTRISTDLIVMLLRVIQCILPHRWPRVITITYKYESHNM